MDSGKVDSVANAFYDALCELTQIDPSAVAPDYKLGADIGIESEVMQRILFVSARHLGLPVEFEFCRIGDSSPREIISRLKYWQANTSRAA
jgi:hypothetical protein